MVDDVSDAPETIEQSYRYELQVTQEQRELLESCLGASRFWFNQGLALVKERLELRAAGEEDVDLPWSYKGLCSAFRGDAIKDEIAPWRTEVVTGSYQAGLEALGSALQMFSAGKRAGRKVGFPEFRSKHNPTHRVRERVIFQRPRITDSRHVTLDRRMGPIRTKESLRKLIRLLQRDPDARILRSTIKRSGDGYVISFTVRRTAALKQQSHAPRRPDAVIGIDLGLTHLATLSTGEKAPNDRPLKSTLQRLKRLQRTLDRQRRANNPGNYDAKGRAKKGARDWHTSRRMQETERLIRRCHARVANLRSNTAHELTTRLVREYGVIGAETLAVANLQKNRRLARAISDVGWGQILHQLQYKIAWSGSTLIQADRFYPSSKTCSSCGTVKAKLSLGERVFACAECGHQDDRDRNAALSLARHALQVMQDKGMQDVHLATEGEASCWDALYAPTGGARRGPTSRSQARDTMKRRGPSGSSRSRKAPAIAAAG